MKANGFWSIILKGAPFFAAFIGGAFLLSNINDTRYRIHKHARKHDVYIPSDPADEPMYKSMVESQNLDDWKNIRGPRPWEDSRAVQEEARKGK